MESLYIDNNDYYEEAYRPLVHFTPQKYWMNDPNGMIYLDGEYHLFYQYNPQTAFWGNMSWGHAVSTDLLQLGDEPVYRVGPVRQQPRRFRIHEKAAHFD